MKYLLIILFCLPLYAQDVITVIKGSGTANPPDTTIYYLISSEGDSLKSSDGDYLVTILISSLYENNNIIDAVYNDCFIPDLRCRSDKRKYGDSTRERTQLS